MSISLDNAREVITCLMVEILEELGCYKVLSTDIDDCEDDFFFKHDYFLTHPVYTDNNSVIQTIYEEAVEDFKKRALRCYNLINTTNT